MAGTVQGGAHQLGQYHYFVTLPEVARSLGVDPEERFSSPEPFLGLVSAVHESYHVYQSLVLGTSCAVITAQDHFTADVVRASRTRQPADIARARLSQGQASSLKHMYYSPDPARTLYEHEARLNPRSAEFLRSLPDMTTRDLLECQAALLAEAYVAWCLSTHPDAYNPDLDRGFTRSVFRMEYLDGYNLPLKFFRERLGKVLNFDLFNAAARRDPLFPFFPRTAEYKLLGFLLDYALHIPPPDMAQADESTLTAHREDINPVVRFIKLVTALAVDVIESMRNPHWPGGGSLDLDALYTEAAPRLAHWIDVNNLLAISENRRTLRVQPSAQSLFPLRRPEVLKALNLDDTPVTFPLPAETSQMWLDVYDSIGRLPERSRLDAIRSTAMKMRKQQPDTFAVWRPLDFFAHLGLTTFFRGPTGLFKGPTLWPSWQVEKEHFDRDDPELKRFWAVSAIPTQNGKKMDVRGYPGLPYGVLDEIVGREVLLAMCESQMNRTPMACPRAVGRIAFYGCPGRTDGCASIATPRQLPRRDCIANSLYLTYLSPGSAK